MYLSKCTSSYSSNTWSSQDFPGNPRSHCRGMGSIPGQGTKITHGAGRGFVKKTTRQTMILTVFTCWLQITVPFTRQIYLTNIYPVLKTCLFFLIPLSKELFINTSISSKISNPWVTLATQSDDSYRTTQMSKNSWWVTVGWKSLRKYWCLWRVQEA